MRLEGWPERLTEVLLRHSAEPFAWGSSDCGIQAADVGLALTGIDAAQAFRGRYKGERGAARALKRAGFTDVVEAFRATFPEEIAPSFARRGDVGVVIHDGQRCLVIIDGVDAVGQHPTGSVRFPRQLIRIAFKVG